MKAWCRALLARVFEHQVRRLIRRHHAGIVAVAGSVGKTSTRMAISAVLSQKFRTQTIAQPGYNSELGLPLSVFELEVPRRLYNPLAWVWRIIEMESVIRSNYPYQMLVLEIGTDHPGEVARALTYLRPDIGVVTAVTPEHMQNFPQGLAQVAAEELLLASASREVVANSDDIAAAFRRQHLSPPVKCHYYGSTSDAEYGLKLEATSPLTGTTGKLTKNGRVVVGHLKLRVYGLPAAKVAAAAYAVGDLLGLSKRELTTGMEKIRAVNGRMRAFPGLNGSIIIDDTYNSSPQAAIAAIDCLMNTPADGRRIAILGSMNELGLQSPRYHEEVGTHAAGVDLLITIGDLANKYLGPAAVAAGLDPTRFKPADSPYVAGEFAKLVVMPGDIVLVKGSQNGIFAEEAVKLLLDKPGDWHHLVRQSQVWQAAKAKQFPGEHKPAL